MNIILFDDDRREHLFPLSLTRPIADFRVGITTIRSKWELSLQHNTSTLTAPYLSKKIPICYSNDNLFINGAIIPNPSLVSEILQLDKDEMLIANQSVIAVRTNELPFPIVFETLTSQFDTLTSKSSFYRISSLFDIFTLNDIVLRDDFSLLTAHRKSAEISDSNTIIGDKKDLFVEENATIEGAVLNCKKGPIYIGRNAEIMEGSLIRGPFALCDYSILKLGAKIYGATTIGPHCKVGGEVNNALFFGYSNKAHDGYLGNSVIGEWCNIGAGSNSSNLKNNYGKIALWSYVEKTHVDTGLQFCGLIMADHAKCGISSMFNSGSVVGVASNIFGAGYHRTFIPSFSYGSTHIGYSPYNLEKAIDVAKRVYERRNKLFDEVEIEIFKTIFDLTFPK